MEAVHDFKGAQRERDDTATSMRTSIIMLNSAISLRLAQHSGCGLNRTLIFLFVYVYSILELDS